EGTDLARVVKTKGPLPAAQACECVRQAALGLQYAHEHGLVHRDIKPSNLLLSVTSDKGQVTSEEKDAAAALVTRHSSLVTCKVLDLGLARLAKPGDGALTSYITPHEAMVMGTPDFMAPEQALDFHGADIRADIYSLGCTLYFL